MPLAVIAPADQAAGREAASSDLQYHLAELGISEEVQVALFCNGVTSLRVFAGLDETREKMRECLKSDLGLDAADGMMARRQIALVISAWEAARVQVNAEDLAKVEARAHALPSSLLSSTFENSFNQIMEKVALPSGLQSLTFSFHFKESIKKVALPSSLQSLAFGSEFN